VFDFLVDNPVIAFAILFVLFRFIGAKRKAAQTEKLPQQTAKPVRSTGNAAADEALRRAQRRDQQALPFQQRLEELARQFEQKLGTTPAPIASAKEAPVAIAGERRAMPPASLQAASLEIGRAEEVLPRESFIEPSSPQRVDYDTTTQSAFEFHQAIEEPVEKAYHLDAFTGFHSADGTRVATASVEQVRELGPAAEGLFTSLDDLRRAFVLSEVLGRPTSLKPSRSI
jgi:hypothetical protein